MFENKDIRWQQRFSNFKKAYKQLQRFDSQKVLNEMETQGLIKAFEYTYELAWKTLQDLLKYKGYNDITGPKPVIEMSFQDAYITDGKGWMRMHKSRNLSSHTYDEETAAQIVLSIRNEYVDLFSQLHSRLTVEEVKIFNAELDE